MKTNIFTLGLIISMSAFSAELVQPNNQCDVQEKEEQCINDYCVSDSAISDSPNCTQICQQCAQESCGDYDTPSEECQDISL